MNQAPRIAEALAMFGHPMMVTVAQLSEAVKARGVPMTFTLADGSRWELTAFNVEEDTIEITRLT